VNKILFFRVWDNNTEKCASVILMIHNSQM